MKIRCFIAVDIQLDREAERKYASILSALQSTGARLKPVEPQNLHVTLKFLGEIEEQRVEKTRAALREVKHEPFSIELRGVGAFPSLGRPRVIWVGVSGGSKELESLRDKIEAALSGLFPREPKNFVAHLTLARVKYGAPGLGEVISQFGQESLGTVTVENFKLKRSKLTPQGPIYSDIEVYPLGREDTESSGGSQKQA